MFAMMAHHQGIPALVRFIGFVIVVVVLLFRAREERRQRRLLYERLAGRLGGRYTAATVFTDHELRFSILDRPSHLVLRRGSQPFSSLRIVLPRDPGGWLRICRNKLSGMFGLLFHGPRFRTQDPRFDQDYRIQGHPQDLAARIFSPQRRQEAMSAVRRLNRCSGFTLEVRSDLLEIRIQETIEDPEVALALVRTGEDFLRFVFDLDADPGIECGECREHLSGRCPICTTVLREPLVRCERCRSPHHQECWEYLGRCATYGCDPKSRQRVA
jgi:hypothetical protein